MHISENVTLIEATKSQTAVRYGIQNIATPQEIARMQYVAAGCFEPTRAALGNLPIYVSSFFRCLALNRKLNSNDASFHRLGAAIDIDGDFFGHHSNRDIFNFILMNLDFTELVWEYGNRYEPAWVHVAKLKGDPRRMVKRAHRENDKTEIISFDLYEYHV